MTRYLNQTAALLAALFITTASLNAIVTVPPVDAVTYSAQFLA